MHHSKIARNRAHTARGGDEWKRALPAIGLLLALTLAVVASRDAHSATYKWVDDKGIVHYADKMPTDAVNRGHVELDRQGIAVRKMDPALTPEQVRARRRSRAAGGRCQEREEPTAAIAHCSRRTRAKTTSTWRAVDR
jgi:hypothetical protein